MAPCRAVSWTHAGKGERHDPHQMSKLCPCSIPGAPSATPLQRPRPGHVSQSLQAPALNAVPAETAAGCRLAAQVGSV